MIRYSLACSEGHSFETWFRDSAGYESQRIAGLLECPHCGSGKVEKQIMAPSVAGSREIVAPEAAQPVALAGEKDREMREMLRAFRKFVEANSEHVGPRFAEEARKIHEGVVEHRAIYGEATPSEVKALHEDGIEVAPLPILPDDRN